MTSAAIVCVENQAPTVPDAADLFARGALSKYGSRHTYLMNDGAGQEVCDQDDGVFHLSLLPPFTNQAEETCQGSNNCIIVGDKTCTFEVNVDAQIIYRQCVVLAAPRFLVARASRARVYRSSSQHLCSTARPLCL